MVQAWGGWESYLAVDVSPTDTTWVLGFDDGIPSTPFDLICGLERVTVVDRPSPRHLTVVRGINHTPADYHYGGPECGVVEVRHQYLVYHGASLFCDLTAIAESCEVDYVMPGGMSQAILTLTTYDPQRYFPNPDATLILSSNESGTFKPYGKGILGVPKETRFDDGSYHYEFTFFGVMDTLGEDGDEYDETIQPVHGFPGTGHGWWVAFTSIGQVIREAITDLCFWTLSLDFSHMAGGGQQIGKEYNGLWKTCLQIINELCAIGDVGVALDWAVFTDAGGGSVFWLYRRDQWNVINIPWSILAPEPVDPATNPVLPPSIPFSWNSRERKNKVVIKYGAGTMPAVASVSERPKSLHRDVSNTIQDASTAYEMGRTILAEVSTLQSLTESPIVFEYKADDPATKYLTDNLGAEIPIWRGEDIIGRLARITGVTATNPNWPISLMQVKTYHVSHGNRTGTAQLGKYVDWTAEINRYGAQDAQRPDSALHTPGVSSAVAAPPDTLSPTGSTTVNVPTLDSAGYTGTNKVQKDLDMAPPQWTYDSADGTPLPVRKYGFIRLSLNGHILGFHFHGTTDADGPSSGVFKIHHIVDGVDTVISTISVSGDTDGEDIFPDAAALDVVAGQYLQLEIDTNDDTTGFTHVAVDASFRRTGGSDRPTSTAHAVLEAVTVSRDVTTGVITFNVVADRPCRAWVAFGTEVDAYKSVTNKTANLTKTPKPQAFASPQGVTMHGVAYLETADGVQTAGTDFTF